jgi:hypothetical protein
MRIRLAYVAIDLIAARWASGRRAAFPRIDARIHAPFEMTCFVMRYLMMLFLALGASGCSSDPDTSAASTGPCIDNECRVAGDTCDDTPVPDLTPCHRWNDAGVCVSGECFCVGDAHCYTGDPNTNSYCLAGRCVYESKP